MSLSPLYDEKELFARIATGDERAFRLLFDAYKEKLAIFTLQFIHSKADAEEIIQDIFLKVWNRKETLAEIDYPKKYMYTMARNQALDLLTRMAKDRQLQEQLWNSHSVKQVPAEDIENLLQAKENEQLIYDALQELSAKKQKIFQLRRKQGMKAQQIADEMDMSLSRVKNVLHEVFTHIKAYMDRHAISFILYFLALSAIQKIQ